jgi:hypothetical protein
MDAQNIVNPPPSDSFCLSDEVISSDEGKFPIS